MSCERGIGGLFNQGTRALYFLGHWHKTYIFNLSSLASALFQNENYYKQRFIKDSVIY